MEYTINVYGHKTLVKKDERFNKKMTVIGGGSDPRIGKRPQGRKVNFNKIKIAVCVALLVATAYMCNANAKQSTVSSETPAVQDEEPNSTITNVDRDKGFISRDMPRDYQESSPKELAQTVINREFGSNEWSAYEELIQRESGWKVGNINKQSGACGLGQAYPCSKFTGQIGNASDEINWSVEYIKGRYSTPTKALVEWKRLKPCGLNKNKLCNWY